MIYHRLGKTPARPDAVKFKLRKYTDPTALPTPPLRFGHFWRVTTPWQDLGNDKYGNCVWAGAAHETMIWHVSGRKKGGPVLFNEKCVLSDYSDAAGFDAKKPDETDNGTDMQAAASYRMKTGILDAKGKRHKIDSYVAITPGDVDELMLACYLFGPVGVGIMFPEIAMKQFDAQQPWTLEPSRVGGGHYIPVVGRNSKGNLLCLTWGRLHAMSPEFYEKYNDESVAYLSFESLDDELMLSREGFDLDTLRKDLKAL